MTARKASQKGSREQAYKPGSVECGHLSGMPVTRHL
jgi:hypothetical protein